MVLVFVLILMRAVGHLLVYVSTGLDFLNYLVYFFALGGNVTVS